jgi:hypothetical protein
MPSWGPKRWGLVDRQRIRFESEATLSSQPAPGGVRRARRARMFGPKNKNKNNFNFSRKSLWNSKPHDQLVQGFLTIAFLASQVQPTDCSSFNQAIGNFVEMNTEASNNNSPPNQEDEDRPMSGDVDFPFEEIVEVEHRNSCFRLTLQFRAGPNAMAKTSERVDSRAFQTPTNQSVLATPNGMLRLICKDNIKCAVLNPSGMAGVPACDSEQTSPAQAASPAPPHAPRCGQ